MKKIFAIIGIVGLVGMTAFSVLSFWFLRPRVATNYEPLTQNLGEGRIANEERTANYESDITSRPTTLGEEQNTNEDIEEKKGEIEKNKSVEEEVEIKESVHLEVPFALQAPYEVWDELHNEACEEAALIIAKYWLTEEELPPARMDAEILKMVSWQEENWGGHYDLDVSHIIKLASQYYGLNSLRTIYNPTKGDIKKELSKANLVISPMAGRHLDNPYYRQPGPVYHMLVVRGYDEKKVITNDPGTRHGENFKYSWDNFLDNIHDWPLKFGQRISKDKAAREILKGAKVVIVVEKE